MAILSQAGYMARKTRTLDQQIADTQAKLARLKDRARSARTHRLCRFAGAFDPIIDDDLLADLALVPADQLAVLRSHLAHAIRRAATAARSAAGASGDTA